MQHGCLDGSTGGQRPGDQRIIMSGLRHMVYTKSMAMQNERAITVS